MNREGKFCEDYADNKWCTPQGQYGPGWEKDWGSFEQRLDPVTAKPAWACPECGCADHTWYQISKKNCWSHCDRKGGPCPDFCGRRGFCCRKGYYDCPLAAEAAADTAYHTCVQRTQKNSRRAPFEGSYLQSVTVISPGMDYIL